MSALDNFDIEPGMPMGFKVELTNPKIHALIGFQYWQSDNENDYNTFKIHLLWLALRWDWV